MQAPTIDTEVLVAGGGPVGLMLACELRLHGVRTLVLDALSGVDETRVRAGGIYPRTIETFDRRGLLERFGDYPRWIRTPFAGMPLTDLSALDSPHPYGAAIPQPRIEHVLEERAVELGAELRRGHTVTGLAQDGDGATVSVTGPQGSYELRASWVAGCDGAGSTVRKAAGIGFPGSDPTMTFWQAAVADPGGLALGFTLTDQGSVGYVGPMAGNRVVWAEPGGRIAERDARVSVPEAQDSIRRISGVTDVVLSDSVVISRFTDNARQAETYRSGRVLLVGDAAHIHPPFGGQGLNTGLLDAVNLGWKLAAEVQETAPEGLLDTYQAERYPVARDVLSNTLAQVALVAPGRHVGHLRGLMQQVLQRPDANRQIAALVTRIDEHYDLGDGHLLVGRWCPDLSLTVDGAQTSVARLSRDGRGLLLALSDTVPPDTGGYGGVDVVAGTCAGAPPAHLLLVRPDGFVAWAGHTAATDGLSAGFQSWIAVG
jgi:2-polyprenyl-6-methoxyphenol hydroxylase-like FAD-dependent oxidoreductase